MAQRSEVAPMAAKSDRALPKSFQPSARGNERPNLLRQESAQEERKCVPSVRPSIVKTSFYGFSTTSSSPGGTVKRAGERAAMRGTSRRRKPRSPNAAREEEPLFFVFVIDAPRPERSDSRDERDDAADKD